MRLSWNEIRIRAATFADDWQEASYEKGETQSFYNDFFEVFGVNRRTVARYEQFVNKLDNSSGFIDLFWPKILIVEQKSAGRNLTAAYDQAGEYFDSLSEDDKPRYILVSDFQNFELHDLDLRETADFELSEFQNHVEKFSFILGVERKTFRDQDPVNIHAAELVGRLHDSLHEAGYTGHDLERFLVRLVFCLFADNTGIFEPRDIFLEFVETRTSEDGADLGPWLSQLFQVFNTEDNLRLSSLDEDLAKFPYINGDLFDGPLRIPSFNGAMRKLLLDACHFDWSNISPAIFGALFQSVMDPVQRRAEGAHYTTEKNILKVIEPLFMDKLRDEFSKLKIRKDRARRSHLRNFQRRLGKMRFFDPACGCGNFLIIAYREIRMLEIDVIREITPKQQQAFDATFLSVVDVDQFFGIEINEFPVRIAEAAMWMMDHIMNNQLSLEFGQAFTRIPLKKTPNIFHADALETDWTNCLPPESCSYIIGNPPYAGAKLQTVEQRVQVRRIANLGGSGGSLDYVAAWFIKAAEYIRNHDTRVGFVSTNSISQGEQVAQLWPILLDKYKMAIAFAHRTFAWGSDARGKAHVDVVIIGLERKEKQVKSKRLFNYPDINGEAEESQHSVISPYLIDGSNLSNPDLAVSNLNKPLDTRGVIVMGSKPIDGGHYIFDDDEYTEFLQSEPNVVRFLRPYVGSREFLHGGNRWILALHNAKPSELAEMPLVRQRMEAVRSYRKASRSASTRNLGLFPTQFHLNVIPTAEFLVIPGVSSERREYKPIGWLKPPVVPSNANFVLENATLIDFAILTSSMHMAWLRNVGGRLTTRYRYSIGLVYNTFPLPKNRNLSRLEPLAQDVLDARATHSSTSLATLYDPNLMPPNLRKAHLAIDRAVDRLYNPKGFSSERERIEHLLMEYEKLTSPLTTVTKRKRNSRGG